MVRKLGIGLMGKLIPATLLMSVLWLAGCNTVEGVGEDLQSGGRAVEDTASDAKK